MSAPGYLLDRISLKANHSHGIDFRSSYRVKTNTQTYTHTDTHTVTLTLQPPPQAVSVSERELAEQRLQQPSFCGRDERVVIFKDLKLL